MYELTLFLKDISGLSKRFLGIHRPDRHRRILPRWWRLSYEKQTLMQGEPRDVKKQKICNTFIFVIHYSNQFWVALLRLGSLLRFCHPPTLAGDKWTELVNPMSLDMHYFEKNRELINQTASSMEEAIKEAGFNFVDCPDEFLKEITDGVGNSYARDLFEYLKLRRDFQKNES